MSLIRVGGNPIHIDWWWNQPSHLSQPTASSPIGAVHVPQKTGSAASKPTIGIATLATAEDLTESDLRLSRASSCL
ncbi:hypothetical protein E2C01_038516 [Portunus trituberculatus]|uniref:Uncharacterized protein n=1 Tax=Portunus trituberculatus TaxID=210409 RepID=A0A5B7FHF1_PORTR|nr:hypothetical protein [Portunus trituberculatus]